MSALVCAISAIITGIQTKSILDDLPSHKQLESTLSLPDAELQHMRRTILRYKKTPGLKHFIMIFLWQWVTHAFESDGKKLIPSVRFPSMTMAYSWCCFLAGLTVYICNPFITRLPWQDRHKVTHFETQTSVD